jgi:7-carboxy-7-deazaguanine synthase (Cx14CxxC type)
MALAYFITFTTYGTWLHGRPPGSVDRAHNQYGAPLLPANAEQEQTQREQMRQGEYRLDEPRRQCVLKTIREVAEHRRWRLWAVHVRTNHVHVVITAEAKPEKVMSDLKAWCSRRLREQFGELSDRDRWTQRGSTKYLWTDAQFAEKVEYTVNGQGDHMAYYDSRTEPEALAAETKTEPEALATVPPSVANASDSEMQRPEMQRPSLTLPALKAFAVKEIFYTLQGEGQQVGRAAVFCRFAGCNLWSGLEKDRADAICNFCDTDFVGGEKFPDAQTLAEAIDDTWVRNCKLQIADCKLVVCTGGEPLLQMTDELVRLLHERGFEVAIETNGTKLPPAGIDWICVSPKANADLVLKTGHELKLIYPQTGAAPERYEALPFEHFFLQPMDGPERERNTQLAVRYCLEHPQWRLSMQTQKYLGIK